jgi:hypothetical protein
MAPPTVARSSRLRAGLSATVCLTLAARAAPALVEAGSAGRALSEWL